MIGVDTNVLVRAVFEDHPKESPLAQQFLKQTAKDKKLFVSSYAVLEMVWVLKVKQRSRQEIYEAVLLTPIPFLKRHKKKRTAFYPWLSVSKIVGQAGILLDGLQIRRALEHLYLRQSLRPFPRCF